jgi:putative membrane protein
MLRWYVLVAVAGFAVELIGVRTGAIFGVYEYGENLGPKLTTVPLMIAVNWWITTICSYALADKLSENNYIQAVFGAALMTGLDALIEPLAPALGFWSFAGGLAPIRNYIGWFVIGFMLQLTGRTLQVPASNPLASTVYFLQIALFIVLNLVNIFT